MDRNGTRASAADGRTTNGRPPLGDETTNRRLPVEDERDERAVRVAIFEHEGDRFAAISLPGDRGRLGRLTSAELTVARLVAAGATNAEIARERKTAVRTVANQVAAILAKLGVSGRRSIGAHLPVEAASPVVSRAREARRGAARKRRKT